jgi:hypothetical protein
MQEETGDTLQNVFLMSIATGKCYQHSCSTIRWRRPKTGTVNLIEESDESFGWG